LISTIPFFLGKYFISLRADKQPIAVSISDVTALIIKIKSRIQPISEKKEIVNPILKNEELFNKILKQQIENYSKQPDRILLNKQLLLLSEYVEYLRKNNVNVCFFEMPINSNLMELPTSKVIRNELFKLFPIKTFDYILPDSSLYETSDGLHLNNIEAIKYTAYFKSQIKNLNYR